MRQKSFKALIVARSEMYLIISGKKLSDEGNG